MVLAIRLGSMQPPPEKQDLKLMRAHSPAHVQVKAAGGIRDFDKLLEVRALGVSRVGASRTTEMLNECKRRLGM